MIGLLTCCSLCLLQHLLVVHLSFGAVEAELGEVGGAMQTLTVMKSDGGSFGDGTKHSVIVSLQKK